MKLFKRKSSGPSFFEDESLDARFDGAIKWIKEMSRKDYNKFKRAMDKGYDAYQILHGIDPDPEEDDVMDAKFMLHEKDGEK